MKRLIYLLVGIALTATIYGCASCYTDGINEEYRTELQDAINNSARAEELVAFIEATPKEQRNDVAFLIVNMPAADRDTMSLELLRENVDYANIARNKYAWSQTLPEDVYLNDVLPYFVVDEVRDAWRKELYELFAPVVEECQSMEEALCAVNSNIPRLTGVDYNTLREKTNQSPRESMRQGMASCTGLSILLVDAYRAVGIPARFVGTVSWHDNRGNHSWTEVWLDGEWRVTEYYFPSKLDHLWFMADASKAKVDDRRYAIYATSFAEREDWFPMIWAVEDKENAIEAMPHTFGAVNVTQHYIDLAYEQYTRHLEAGTHTFLRIAGYAKQGITENSGDRVAMGVDVFCGTEQMGGGLTAGPLRDMNDMFSVLLPKNAKYVLRYYNGEGELQRESVILGEEPTTVEIFLEK